jgi:hypothetical protein
VAARSDPSAGRRHTRAAAHRELAAATVLLDPERLDEPVGGYRSRELGSGVSWYVMLHGVSQHDAYHLGQVALLRKLTNP